MSARQEEAVLSCPPWGSRMRAIYIFMKSFPFAQAPRALRDVTSHFKLGIVLQE